MEKQQMTLNWTEMKCKVKDKQMQETDKNKTQILKYENLQNECKFLAGQILSHGTILVIRKLLTVSWFLSK